MATFDIAIDLSFIEAMADWNGGSGNNYALTTDVTLSVTDLHL